MRVPTALLLASVVSAYATTVFLTVTKTVRISAEPSAIHHPMLPTIQHPFMNTTSSTHILAGGVPLSATVETLTWDWVQTLAMYRSFVESTQPAELPRFRVDFDGHGKLVIGIEDSDVNTQYPVTSEVVTNSGSTEPDHISDFMSNYMSDTSDYMSPSTSTTTTRSDPVAPATVIVAFPTTLVTSVSIPVTVPVSPAYNDTPTSTVVASSWCDTTRKKRILPQITHELPDMAMFRRNYTLHMLSGARSLLAGTSYASLLFLLFAWLCFL